VRKGDRFGDVVAFDSNAEKALGVVYARWWLFGRVGCVGLGRIIREFCTQAAKIWSTLPALHDITRPEALVYGHHQVCLKAAISPQSLGPRRRWVIRLGHEKAGCKTV
jgi:hypothetical protein